MSQIIEFMGLPGSGKSTLATRLLADAPDLSTSESALLQCYKHRQRGLARALVNLLPPVLWKGRIEAQETTVALHAFSCAYPELMRITFDVVVRANMPADWRSCVLYAMLKRFGNHHLMATESDARGAVVVEEGLALGLITLIGSLPVARPCDADIVAYVEKMPHLSEIVYVKADIAQCATRLLQRAELPLLWAGSSRDELEAQLTFSQSIFDRAVPLLMERGISVCTVENQDGSLDSVSTAVRQFTVSCMQMKGESERA
jgi:hypothetical protein